MPADFDRCPIHDGDIQCDNKADPRCIIAGRPEQGEQLDGFRAVICRDHYLLLTGYHTGTVKADLRN